MARRKRSLQRARARPKGTRAAKRAKSASRKQLWPRLGVVGVLAIAALLGTFVLVTAGGGRTQAAQESRIDHQVSSLLAGIPQQGDTLGRPTAPVTLQVFGDLECYDARHWFVKYLPAIIQDFVRTGIIRIQYRSFKTDTIYPTVFVNQQTAALAAGAQNKLWNFIETFYHEQGTEYTRYVTENYLNGIARQTPKLNLTQWQLDRGNGRRSEQVTADDQTAKALGFHDTPAFRIGNTHGPMYNFTGRKLILYIGQKNPVSLIDAQDLKKAIKALPLNR